MAVQKNKGSSGGDGKPVGENPGKGAGAKAPAGKKRKSPKTPWGIVFWTAFFIMIFFLFFVNRANIIKTFNDTRFFERIMNRQVTGIDDPRFPLPEFEGEPLDTDGAESNTPIIKTVEAPPEEKVPAPEKTEPNPAESAPASGGRPSPAAEPVERKTPASKEPQTTAPAPPPVPPRTPPKQESAVTRERSLYFTRIDSDGDILRVPVKRQFPFSDSPMLDVLNSLLAGPAGEEKNRGLVSLIPGNTKILNATVRGETAYISFSAEFQYNPHGVEGYAASLREIIWTVTEFSNVNDVQILIEGRRIDYLGEGIWIGSPINRTF